MAVRDSVKLDPAIERWNHMREDAYKHFRWTPRTTRIAVWGFIIIPGLVYYTSTVTDAKYKWSGKLKGEPLSN